MIRRDRSSVDGSRSSRQFVVSTKKRKRRTRKLPTAAPAGASGAYHGNKAADNPLLSPDKASGRRKSSEKTPAPTYTTPSGAAVLQVNTAAQGQGPESHSKDDAKPASGEMSPNSLRNFVAKELSQKYGARGSIRDVFRGWDNDKSGAISKQEFVRVMGSVGLPLSRPQLETVYDMFDTDHNGGLDYAEFIAALEGNTWTNPLGEATNNDSVAQLERLRARAGRLNIHAKRDKLRGSAEDIIATLRKRYQHKSSLRSVFRAWDLNKDGAVSVDELSHAMHAIGLPVSEQQANELLAKCDEDKDGDIQYDEFVDMVYGTATEDEKAKAAWGVTRPNPISEEEAEDVAELQNRVSHHRQDVGNVKVASRVAELRVELALKVEQHGLSLQDLFLQFDEDRDGTISYPEYRNTLHDLGIGTSKLDHDLLIAAADRDGEGRIEYDELTKELAACKFAVDAMGRSSRKKLAASGSSGGLMGMGQFKPRHVLPLGQNPPPPRTDATGLVWAGRRYPHTPVRLADQALRGLGGEGVITTAAIATASKSDSAANLMRSKRDQRFHLLSTSHRNARQRPSSAPAHRRPPSSGSSDVASRHLHLHEPHVPVSTTTIFNVTGDIAPRDTLAPGPATVADELHLRTMKGSASAPALARQTRGGRGVTSQGDASLRSTWLKSTMMGRTGSSASVGMTASRGHGRHAHTPFHDTRYLLRPEPRAKVKSDFNINSREQFRVTSRRIGSAKEKAFDVSEREKKKQRYQNKLKRIRANQLRVEQSNAASGNRERDVINAERRMRTLVKQKLEYMESLADRLAYQRKKREKYQRMAE